MKAAAAFLCAISLSACGPMAATDGSHGLRPAAARPAGSSYRISGDSSVRPLSVSDDGVKMEIVWSRAQAIPAVFSVGDQGREEVVNGNMRDDIYVIDRVYTELLFRIDKARARARRVVPRNG
jgi:type IV secretion system protein VirB9